MNKKQKEVCEWLSDKPGYVKCSAKQIQNYIARDHGLISVKDISVALKNTRPKSKKKPKVVLKSLSDIFPWVKNYSDNTLSFKKDVSELSKKRNQPGTYLVTGCAHAPWQNKAMYDSVFEFISSEVNLYGIILAGDIVDLNSLSSHDKGKKPLKGVTLDWEYEEANKFLDQFDELDVKGTKDFLYGNHEDRYSRYMSNIDNSKLGASLMSPDVGLKLKERGYNIYNDWKNDAIHLGHHLDITHGEFLNIHTAKKTIDTYRKSTMYFHTHRFQIYVEGLVGGFNMGFGGDINAEIFGYATRAMKTSWMNSCALVTLDVEGFYHVQPLIYMNNRLIVNGKTY